MSTNDNNEEAEKTNWPEVVGKSSSEAKRIIQRETGGRKTVHVIPTDSLVTMDYRLDRIRIFENDQGKVAKSPTLG
jgi:hypothetical protein